jgi:hypothetical protein
MARAAMKRVIGQLRRPMMVRCSGTAGKVSLGSNFFCPSGGVMAGQ